MWLLVRSSPRRPLPARVANASVLPLSGFFPPLWVSAKATTAAGRIGDLNVPVGHMFFILKIIRAFSQNSLDIGTAKARRIQSGAFRSLGVS